MVIAARCPRNSSTLPIRQLLKPTETFAVQRSILASSSPLPGSDEDAGRQLMGMIQSIIECRSPARAARPTIRLPGQEVPFFPRAAGRRSGSSLTPTFCAALYVYGVAAYVADVAAAGADRCVLGEAAARSPVRCPWPVDEQKPPPSHDVGIRRK